MTSYIKNMNVLLILSCILLIFLTGCAATCEINGNTSLSNVTLSIVKFRDNHLRYDCMEYCLNSVYYCYYDGWSNQKAKFDEDNCLERCI